MLRRRGFTLIELLVVIAIIGILAAMLFPVFARARESARKTQCLANVKNIAIAFNMYFADYDAFPPGETGSGVISRFATVYGCDLENFATGCCPNATLANPYLRWPVILDDYTKNRDIWRCPSAKSPAFAGWIVGSPDWIGEVEAVAAAGCNGCPCQVYWPNGWGGSATDTLWLEQASGGDSSLLASPATGAFEVDYRANEREDLGRKLATIDDPSNHFVVAERSIKPDFWGIEQIAYPEICRVFWNSDLTRPEDCAPTCSQGTDADCGPPDQDSTDIKAWINNFWGDASLRSKYTRHLGGNNLGFADGHARWMTAGAMIAAANADPQTLAPIGAQDLPE